MNTQLNQRMGHADETQHKLNQAKGDTSKLKSMIHGLDLQINDYEKLNARLVEEQKSRLQSNSQEYNRAHELTASLQSLEAKFYSLEVDERGKNTDLEAVNYSNQALMDRNLDLKCEYEALQKHIVLLTQQNKELQRELDSFVETDDIVRRNLDRKDKVAQIRAKVDTVMHTNSKSPNARSMNTFTAQNVQATSFNLGNASHSINNRDFSPARRSQNNYQYVPRGNGSPLRHKSDSPGRM